MRVKFAAASFVNGAKQVAGVERGVLSGRYVHSSILAECMLCIVLVSCCENA
jgi:hypothetical protein